MTPEEQRAVDQAIIAGGLIDAIRQYRVATGAGLVEAKDYVEARPSEMDPVGSAGPSSVGAAAGASSGSAIGAQPASWTVQRTPRAAPLGGCLIGVGILVLIALLIYSGGRIRGR
jgi:hypothetical protein